MFSISLKSFGLIRSFISSIRFVIFVTSISLRSFSATVKALKYTLSDTNYNLLTNFGKSVYDLHHSSDVVYPYSSEAIYLDNQSALSIHNSYGTKIGDKEETHPITYFRSGKDNNAIDYFNGMQDYNENRWERVFGGYK